MSPEVSGPKRLESFIEKQPKPMAVELASHSESMVLVIAVDSIPCLHAHEIEANDTVVNGHIKLDNFIVSTLQDMPAKHWDRFLTTLISIGSWSSKTVTLALLVLSRSMSRSMPTQPLLISSSALAN